MASYSKRQALILLLLSLFAFSSIPMPSHARVDDWITISWGQHEDDGTLASTCDTRNYEIVILSSLSQFGCGRTPALHFEGGEPSQADIEHCQERGVEVFLSIGGKKGNNVDYSLCSAKDAKNFAQYLYDNFLSGKDGPLGTVALDGVEFDIESGSSEYYDDLLKELVALRKKYKKNYYLAAAPECPVHDHHLDTAIRTGLFDDLFIKFYNNPACQYEHNNGRNLIDAWKAWTSPPYTNEKTSVFLGLPVDKSLAPDGGYIPPKNLIANILPRLQESANYGGVSLWDRGHDVHSKYSDKIRPYVLNSAALQPVTAISEAISECVSNTLHRMLPKTVPDAMA